MTYNQARRAVLNKPRSEVISWYFANVTGFSHRQAQHMFYNDWQALLLVAMGAMIADLT